jgi:hypothetical protein
VHILDCDVVARHSRKTLELSSAPSVHEGKIPKDNVRNGSACARHASCVALPRRLVAAFNMDSPAWYTGGEEIIIQVCNVADVATVLDTSLDVNANSPFAHRLVHPVVLVQHILDSTCDGAAYGDSHASPQFVVADRHVLARRALAVSAGQNCDVVVATADIVVLNHHILAAVYLCMPSTVIELALATVMQTHAATNIHVRRYRLRSVRRHRAPCSLVLKYSCHEYVRFGSTRDGASKTLS